MVAAEHGKVASHVGELTDFDGFHPCAVHAEGDVVLRFAGGAARMTADAFRLVDDPGVIHGRDSAVYSRDCLGVGGGRGDRSVYAVSSAISCLFCVQNSTLGTSCADSSASK